jgi:hypothetical protein
VCDRLWHFIKMLACFLLMPGKLSRTLSRQLVAANQSIFASGSNIGVQRISSTLGIVFA